MKHQGLIDAVAGYYTDRIREHGPTPRGVDWNGSRSQDLRFVHLLAGIPPGDEPSLLDYGCGYGAILDTLAALHEHFRYQGYDVSPAMLDAARLRYSSDPRASFAGEPADLRRADFTVASGIFNVRLDASASDWRQYVLETLDAMAVLSIRGMAFNALTSHADPDLMRPHLYYADPSELLDHCLRTYSRDVTLRHDYGLYEFTILVKLDGRPPARSQRGAS